MNDCKVVTLVSLATYGFFFVVILFLALTLSSEEKSDYASALFLIFTTFFAGSWGHITPNFEVGRAVCSLTAMLGYMCPLVAAFFMFVCMSQDSLAFMAAKAFWLAYFCTALLANFTLAAGLSADCLAAEESWMSEKCDYGSQLYFAWMTFHLRAYGEVAPTGPGSNFISLVIVMFGSLCWVVPLFTVARKTGRDCSLLALKGLSGPGVAKHLRRSCCLTRFASESLCCLPFFGPPCALVDATMQHASIATLATFSTCCCPHFMVQPGGICIPAGLSSSFWHVLLPAWDICGGKWCCCCCCFRSTSIRLLGNMPRHCL